MKPVRHRRWGGARDAEAARHDRVGIEGEGHSLGAFPGRAQSLNSANQAHPRKKNEGRGALISP
jgi:hypothetical protein